MKICSKCKIEKPLTEFHKKSKSSEDRQTKCKMCCSEYSRQWAKENKDKIAQRISEWQKANPEKCAQRNKRYKDANKDKVSKSASEYHKRNASEILRKKKEDRISNPEKYRERAARYNTDNKEKRKASTLRWREGNRDKIAELKRVRRAKALNAEGVHTRKDVALKFELQRGFCANCEGRLFKSGPKKYHIDHIMPLALGGSNWPENIQCLCPSCNLRKSAKDPFDWAKENGRLL